MALPTFCAAALLVVASAAIARADTLYDRLGQKPGLEQLVTTAATIWTHDPKVAPTFEETNMDRFKQMLVQQLCQLTGGDCRYTGRGMHDSHAGLHIDTAQFNALVEDLQAAMDQCDIPFHTQNRLIALLAPMYRDVVTR